MKAGNGFCTWRSFVGAAMVGALAIAVSVQGSPRVGAGGGESAPSKSDAARVLTGPGAQINAAIAAGATATISLQPVNPKTVPASSYPAGSSISGGTLTLGATPARVWFDILLTGWAPQELKTIQVKIDAAGYMGVNADCAGTPANGGDLAPALQACGGNPDCRTTISGLSAPCVLGEPSTCSGGFCFAGYQDKCNAGWVNTQNGAQPVAAVNTSTLNYTFGATSDPGDPIVDHAPSYIGTLVLDVPADAKGAYTIGYVLAETFLQDQTTPVAKNIPLAAANPGVVDVPCGSCCTNLGANPTCTDQVSAGECDALPTTNVGIFRAGTSCAEEECPTCTQNSDCNDNDACTTDTCNVGTGVCTSTPIAAWNQATECCNAANGARETIVSPDQCVSAACSLPGNRGTLVLNDRTGESCDDNNPCTFADTCAAGADSCAGADASSATCNTPEDCEATTGVAYPCVDGFCFCTLTPEVTINIDPSGKNDDNCFDSGDPGAKVTGAVHVGASSSPINGAQIGLTYDPTCLVYNGISGVDPFTNTVYGPVVDETAGTIFIAVGVQFGAGDGPNGNADLVAFSFTKIGDCNSCEVCFLGGDGSDVNPLETYLSDNDGQRISVETSCSKAIRANNVVVLTTPDTIKTNVDCDRPTAVETWDAPSATDSCGSSTVFCRGEHESGYAYDQGTVLNGGELAVGASSFCCYAVSDYCGKIVGCPPDTDCATGDDGKPEGCWTVEVNDETSLDITIQLSPTAQSKPGDSLTRGIKFSLYSNCVQEPQIFCDDITFGGLFDFVGKFHGKIKLGGSGQWDCITAEDQLHTLRSCYTFGPGDCVDGQLNAEFVGDPAGTIGPAGNWLVGGNLDGWKKDDPNANPSLDVINILDFGTFVAEYLKNYGFTDTPCGTAGPNADINGDGVVDLDDYAFVSMNFLVSSKECCCGPQTASSVVNAITEISVAQLRAQGLGDLVVADLNGDGLLNLADMAAFDQGVRPSKKSSTKGGSRSTGTR